MIFIRISFKRLPKSWWRMKYGLFIFWMLWRFWKWRSTRLDVCWNGRRVELLKLVILWYERISLWLVFCDFVFRRAPNKKLRLRRRLNIFFSYEERNVQSSKKGMYVWLSRLPLFVLYNFFTKNAKRNNSTLYRTDCTVFRAIQSNWLVNKNETKTYGGGGTCGSSWGCLAFFGSSDSTWADGSAGSAAQIKVNNHGFSK